MRIRSILLAVAAAATLLGGLASAQTGFVGTMSLAPVRGTIGSTVTVTARQLPANHSYALVWESVKASWVLKGAYKEDFAGRDFQPTRTTLETVTSGPDGTVHATFAVPEGFGFGHTVALVDQGRVVNQSGFTVEPQASLASKQGPEGSPIQITLKGIGARSYTNNWMLLYDHKDTGWLSSVTTNGTAHVTLPATGGPGKHVITIIHGAYTFPYLNTGQSPHKKPVFHLTYTITPGQAVLPPKASAQSLPRAAGSAPSGTGTAAWVTPASGTNGEPVTVHARDLPANSSVQLSWSRMVGSHVTASGYKLESLPLGKASVGSDGTLTTTVTPPSDLGGEHTIDITTAGGKELASTRYTLTPSAAAISPERGPVGTTFTLHLDGVGWTDTANIYTVDYDNAFIGYACGFNSQGDVKIPLEATGRPGWHYITLYPAIYKGKDIQGTDDFRLPQLTYAKDHPGETLPAFHFAFYVTGKQQ
ncbi:MAG: hypothetical protein P8Y13_11335 [Deinococcales bacterium]